MSLISEGAKRPFQKTALTLDSYSDMSGACADGDHSSCKMVHVDVSDFCLCQEHDEHMSYPSQGVGLQDLASRKKAELTCPSCGESSQLEIDEDGAYCPNCDVWAEGPHTEASRKTAELDFTQVGSKFNQGEVKNQIAQLEWHDLSEGLSAPMMPGEAIKAAIAELRIPNVTRVAWNGVIQNRYGFYGIEGTYSNGAARIYVVDEGDTLTPVASELLS